jgi:hypothetical protein
VVAEGLVGVSFGIVMAEVGVGPVAVALEALILVLVSHFLAISAHSTLVGLRYQRML